MKSFPDFIQFQKTWRTYQARVLADLEEHLDDGHLNVVAAPGSGKTVLGLEVVRRLNQPALILSPSIAIREQWIDRFMNMFFPAGHEQPDWISKDIRNPKMMTVSTYQALHSVLAGVADPEKEEQRGEAKEESDEEVKLPTIGARGIIKNEAEKITRLFQEAGLKTLVLDEAHHLRSEWWKSLAFIKESLPGLTVVSLTATPPYDVSPHEWDRYKSLCGPVDAEVPVPELVGLGDLCPHQDSIYMNTPTDEEQQQIKGFRQEVERILTGISQNQALIEALLAHPCINDPDANIEKILEEPAFFSSVLIFLNHAGGVVPARLLKIMGHEKKRLPPLNLEWWEILLTGLLFIHSESFGPAEALLKPFRQDLSRIGAVERREVVLRHTDKIKKVLLSSINKMSSIHDIVRIESQALGPALRMVVLTDFIRKTELPVGPDDVRPLNRLGVVPIFESIRRASMAGGRLGILTGSLVIIPQDCKDRVKAYAHARTDSSRPLRFDALACDKNFLVMEIGDPTRDVMVQVVTRLFSEGHITVLVGTKSLLGEGWDAPAMNTLVLASFVGSYMLSNQMRGRAIRSLPGDPDKTANVWHLVCVEEEAPNSGEDYEMLSRRFMAFVGVSHQGRVIENGITRLGLGSPPFNKARINQINREMIQRALDREGLRQLWHEALKNGKDGSHMVEEIRANKSYLPRDFVFRNTLTALFWQGLLWGGYVLTDIMRAFSKFRYDWAPRQVLIMLGYAFGAAAIVAVPKCLKSLWLIFRHGRIESSMRLVGEALVKALCHSGCIKTDISKLKVRAEQDGPGYVLCSLEGGTSYDKSLFLDSFQEILDPIENPRYILARGSVFGWFFRKDYHALPEILGKTKETAIYFEKMWRKYVGPVRLHYTRTLVGRQRLLRARINSVSYALQKRADRRSCWK